MIPQNLKEIDWSYKPSKGLDTENEVYKKYGKEYRIDDYVNEAREGTSAKEIIAKAGGIHMLPNINEKFKDTGVVIDMNEDIFTINQKIKLGQIAKRKLDAIKAEKERIAKEQAAKEQKTEE